jgi:hypothetical protein
MCGQYPSTLYKVLHRRLTQACEFDSPAATDMAHLENIEQRLSKGTAHPHHAQSFGGCWPAVTSRCIIQLPSLCSSRLPVPSRPITIESDKCIQNLQPRGNYNIYPECPSVGTRPLTHVVALCLCSYAAPAIILSSVKVTDTCNNRTVSDSNLIIIVTISPVQGALVFSELDGVATHQQACPVHFATSIPNHIQGHPLKQLAQASNQPPSKPLLHMTSHGN